MKKSLSIFMAACIMWLMTIQTSCIGSFSLTKSWWDYMGGWKSKFGAGIVYLLVGGIVTWVTLFVDTVILNLIEFWSGDGPLGLEEGETEQQLVMGQDGNMYDVTATKNRFDIVQLNGENAGAVQSLIYNPADKSWSHEKGCEVNKVVQYSENGEFVTVFGMDGKMATVPTSIQDKEVVAEMMKEQVASQVCSN